LIEVRIPHRLARAEAQSRLQALAQRRSVVLTTAPDGLSGTIEKTVPFIGSAKASYEVAADALLVRVLEAPAFLSEATLRRMLEDELGRAFA
jgi:hypothetical protein